MSVKTAETVDEALRMALNRTSALQGRIRELEAEVERMRPVAEAAQVLMKADNSYSLGQAQLRVYNAVVAYQASKTK